MYKTEAKLTGPAADKVTYKQGMGLFQKTAFANGQGHWCGKTNASLYSWLLTYTAHAL